MLSQSIFTLSISNSNIVSVSFSIHSITPSLFNFQLLLTLVWEQQQQKKFSIRLHAEGTYGSTPPSWLISWNSLSSQTLHITLSHRCELLTLPHNMANIWKWLYTMSYSVYSTHLALHSCDILKSGSWHWQFVFKIDVSQPEISFFSPCILPPC